MTSEQAQPRGTRRGSGPVRPRPGGTAAVDAAGRDELGRALRRVYAELLAAPVPERFTAILAALDGGIPPHGTAPLGAAAAPARDGTEEASR
ncbi:NepR family anti-sigma factor [Methylobacterium sp. ID0610]|uniref:NepR family anti-sigma factor n=1 Tax=Methylobacterium carpenticola TaxID=3344827 RepID=UPI0036817E81